LQLSSLNMYMEICTIIKSLIIIVKLDEKRKKDRSGCPHEATPILI